MKDLVSCEADQQKDDSSNLRKVMPDKPDRRSNLDEVARYVIEGLNRRKTEEQNYGSDSSARH